MRFACWRKDKSVPVRAEVRTLKDVAPSNFSSTPLPERNRGNSYRESGLFCQQFILAIHFGNSFWRFIFLSKAAFQPTITRSRSFLRPDALRDRAANPEQQNRDRPHRL